MNNDNDMDLSPAAELVEELTEIAIGEPVPEDAALEKAMLRLATEVITAREIGDHSLAAVHLDTIEHLGASWEALNKN